MKIWEIEEGREFRVIDHTVYNENLIFKLINKEIYVKTDKYKSCFDTFAMSYNAAVTIDFEYITEKRYYLRLKPEMRGEYGRDYLNFVIDENIFYISDNDDTDAFKCQFTEKEIKELIPPLWLDVCGEPIEVGDE